MSLETKGQFILPEQDLEKGRFILLEQDLATGEIIRTKPLSPNEKVVLGESGEYKIEVEVRKGEAAVLVSSKKDGSFARHRWGPPDTFTRSDDYPLNHGASFNSEKQRLSLVVADEAGRKMERTILWEKTEEGEDAGITRG